MNLKKRTLPTVLFALLWQINESKLKAKLTYIAFLCVTIPLAQSTKFNSSTILSKNKIPLGNTMVSLVNAHDNTLINQNFAIEKTIFEDKTKIELNFVRLKARFCDYDTIIESLFWKEEGSTQVIKVRRKRKPYCEV